MSKRSQFTTITPLPSSITREVVLEFLHDHEEMIDLNPLVKERHPIPVPPHAPLDEQHCKWYSLTDKIAYLPGGLAEGDVTYTCAFHDLEDGLQTHCYAPAGLKIRDKWTVAGSLSGEAPRPAELGLNVPLTGLYLREDVNMKCNVFMTSFVKKTLKKSHAALVDRLKAKAEIASSGSRYNKTQSSAPNSSSRPISPATGAGVTPRSHSPSVTRTTTVDSSLSVSSCYSRSSTPSTISSTGSAQSSPLWSPSAQSRSSIITSPPLSIKSPPLQPGYAINAAGFHPGGQGHKYSLSNPAAATHTTTTTTTTITTHTNNNNNNNYRPYSDRKDSFPIPETPFLSPQSFESFPSSHRHHSHSHSDSSSLESSCPPTPFLSHPPPLLQQQQQQHDKGWPLVGEREDWPLPSPPRSSHSGSSADKLELEVRDTEIVQNLIPDALRIVRPRESVPAGAAAGNINNSNHNNSNHQDKGAWKGGNKRVEDEDAVTIVAGGEREMEGGKLWSALGGGRGGRGGGGKDDRNRNGNTSNASTNTITNNGNNNNNSNFDSFGYNQGIRVGGDLDYWTKGHSKADGGAEVSKGYHYDRVGNGYAQHPDYPVMNPYADYQGVSYGERGY